MRQTLIQILQSAIGVALLCAGLVTVEAANERPNVLFIAVDDLNHWVTHLGRNPQANTPNIDRLAQMGVSFTRAYCAVPACEPSRAALMSGRRPWSTGCYSNGDNWKMFQKPGEGLSAQFMKAGYHVAGAGKIYHSFTYHEEEWTDYMSVLDRSVNGRNVKKMDGYHEPMNHDLKDDELLDWHSVDYCVSQIQEERNQPFFVACGLYKPHLPFAVPRKYYDLFPLDSIQLPPHREDDLDDLPPAALRMAKPHADHARFLKSGRWKHAIQSYLATCAYTDMNIGRLLDGLEASGHRGNTIIVLWGDHGWSFGEKQHWRKFALWEEETRMPLIWTVPGVTRPGTVSNRTVDLMSVYPTLCELTEITQPDHVEARSITCLLKDPSATWETPAITTHGFKNHSVRTEGWRYTRYENGDEELYDETTDPYEWANLAGDVKYDRVRKELAAWLPDENAPPPKLRKKN